MHWGFWDIFGICLILNALKPKEARVETVSRAKTVGRISSTESIDFNKLNATDQELYLKIAKDHADVRIGHILFKKKPKLSPYQKEVVDSAFSKKIILSRKEVYDIFLLNKEAKEIEEAAQKQKQKKEVEEAAQKQKQVKKQKKEISEAEYKEITKGW